MSYQSVIYNDSMHSYLLSTYHMPGTGLDAGDAMMRKTELALVPEEVASQ